VHVDFHCHLTPTAYLEAIRRAPGRWGASLERDGDQEFIVPAGYAFAVRWPLTPGFWDPAARIEHMGATGVDVQALSAPTYLFYYWAEPALAHDVAQMTNEGIAAVARAHPDRFLGMATLPLQDPKRAADELARAVRELGLRALEMGSQVAGRDLDDRSLDPVYERAQALDVPIFVHPNGAEGGSRTQRFYFGNVLGFPFDTTIAAASLIFGGVLERFPRLTFCFAHGGGFLPYQIGRLDHAARARPECRGLPRPPSEYLARMCYDTLTHSHEALRWLVGLVGDERVLLASDYPYDMGEEQPVRFVEESGLPRPSLDRILGANAARLLKV
jgi:aminocarboxymuconate-semialdehyde decarboxylase